MSSVLETQTSAIAATDLSVIVSHNGAERSLLDGISLNISAGEFVAIIGPSGCGKSTLLRSLAGIQPLASGSVFLAGHPAEALQEKHPMACGYLSQTSAFHEDLTIGEILDFAIELRLPKTISMEAREEWLSYIVELSQLRPLLGQQYKTLSGGQMRRISLAEALIGDPPFLFLDELTSGLDPHADEELMQWLADLAHKAGKTIVLVTHSISRIDLCDSIVFLNKGRIIYHGGYGALLEISGTDIAEIYRNADTISLPRIRSKLSPETAPVSIKTVAPPEIFRQFYTLAKRQLVLVGRDRGQLILQMVLVITFPALVAIFALKGLPEVKNLSLDLERNVTKTLVNQLLYMKDAFHSASLVSGLAMFQVILLTLMGANNGAREIAKERNILDKELRAGLSPAAYAAVKLCKVAAFSLVQSLWMTWFVKTVCGFPGEFAVQFIVLFAATLAMSAICLAISAASASPEKASLLAIYFVGLQLPLSGAVLALPEWVTWMTRPFISAYWGWSGYLKTLQPFRLYDVLKDMTKTYIAGSAPSLLVLLLHTIVSFGIALYFVNHNKKFSQ